MVRRSCAAAKDVPGTEARGEVDKGKERRVVRSEFDLRASDRHGGVHGLRLLRGRGRGQRCTGESGRDRGGMRTLGC